MALLQLPVTSPPIVAFAQVGVLLLGGCCDSFISMVKFHLNGLNAESWNKWPWAGGDATRLWEVLFPWIEGQTNSLIIQFVDWTRHLKT